MNIYYKRLMNSQSSFIARFLDAFFLAFAATVISFVFALIKLKSMLPAAVIAVCTAIIAVMLITKIADVRFNRFKNKINKEIRNKLILERIVFDKEEPRIKGYKSIGGGELLSKSGRKARLLIAYPKTVLTPAELLDYISADTDEIIATCDFDDDCTLLCSRKGIELYNKDFLLKNAIVDIDEKMIEQEIVEEVKRISDLKRKRQGSVFKRDRRNKYLFAGLLFLFLSGFMGIYRIIYVAFGGMCMTFFAVSGLLSKSE